MRRGRISARQMSYALGRIARFVGRRAEELAVTKVSRRHDPFHVLVATIISLRTKDEVTDVVAPRLLRLAPNPRAMLRLSASRIARMIYPAGFYRTKARTLRAIAEKLLAERGGRVPATIDELLELKGVGRKTANLVVTLGYGKPGICVDTHVHRISNRLGFVRTRSPDETEQALRASLPPRWWIPVNDILVAFGRLHCTPLSPHCSNCPVTNVCLRVGVERHR